MAEVRYPFVLFDWGDTVMKDDPSLTVPMVDWPQVYEVKGVAEVLSYLVTTGRRCVLATSANISDEEQIRGALARVHLDRFFHRIYSFKNTGIPKGEDFYRYILSDLGIDASQALMVGDHLEKDVLAANAVGMQAVWFDPGSNTGQEDSPLHERVSSMSELLYLFKTLDGLGASKVSPAG